MPRRLYILAAVWLMAMSAIPACAAQSPSYTITRIVPIGTPDKWDFLYYDLVTHHLFVTQGTVVTVIDGRSGANIGRVTGFNGAHGVALSAQGNQGFATSGETGSVIPFDPGSLHPGTPIKAADDADAIIYDPVSNRIYAANGDSGSVTIIDPKNLKAVATVKIGEKLEFLVSDGAGHLFVNDQGKNSVLTFDTKLAKVSATWSLSNCRAPHGLAFDPDGNRLFVTCSDGRMSILDAASGKELANIAIGSGSDAALYDPRRKLAFSSNGTGTLSVVRETSPGQYAVTEIPTEPGARTMAEDIETGRIFLVTADVSGTVQTGGRARFSFKPGTLHVLFLDPMP